MTQENRPVFWTFNLVLIVVLTLSGCVRNEPWRTGEFGESETKATNVVVYTPENGPDQCEPKDACAKALVEVFQDADGRDLFEINYIEFTERGNVFDTARTDFVRSRINKYSSNGNGVITIVFIHGWKNNASTHNENVQAFRNRLALFAQESPLIGQRRVVGVYIGWRGASVTFPVIKELTFWDRKAVAQKIGKGGVTDVLLDLEAYDAANPYNVLVVIGHSFGGAILLSAYSELILDRVKTLANNRVSTGKTPLADALVLINPAIEANEMLRVKEAIITHQGSWDDATPNLMRVLSSKADKATHRLFPLGQWLGTALTWNQDQLFRAYHQVEDDPDSAKYLHESTLDRTTVGNFLPFHTQEMLPTDDTSVPWELKDLCQTDSRQLKGRSHRAAPTFPCSNTDPVQFVYTPKEFMRGHSDIFNDEVSAYIISSIDSALREVDVEMGSRPREAKADSFEQEFRKAYEVIKGADVELYKQ